MESLDIFNTSMDPYNNIDTSLVTTVHLFRFNYITNNWDYVTWYDIGPEGHAADLNDTAADYAPWRFLSSQAAVIVAAEWQFWDTLSCCCCMCADNMSAFSPNRENGFQVSTPGQPATFYGIVQPKMCNLWGLAVTTNLGAVDAQVTFQTYLPDSSIGDPMIPVNLRDTGGKWITKGNYTIPAGFANPGNPLKFDGPPFSGMGATLFRAKLTSGGPIQIIHGGAVYGWWSGGAVVHASNGRQLGNNFWVSQTGCTSCKNAQEKIFGFEIFCPKSGSKVQCYSETGYSAAYTTNGTDQCVLFTAITAQGKGTKANYQMTVTGGAALCIMNMDRITEKGYTAPFLALGTHYEITVPPVAYVGTPIWITVVVVDASADTKTDYCGTTSFTSTDPTAQMGGSPMDAFNFTWSSVVACTSAPDENGVKVFVNVIFNKLGFQTIVASDTTDGSITGLAALQVVGVDLKFTKTPRLVIAASADTVQFKICWSNYSSASAFTLVLTDAVPVGTTFVPEAASTGLSCGNTDGVAVAVSTLTTAAPPLPASFTTANPVAGTRWLRWTVPYAGILTTGCACFRITIN
jgi:uncharacterized repeat protein (TIGR01451 family)